MGFFQHYQAMKVETTKALMDWALYDKLLRAWHSRTKRVLGTPVYLATKVHPSKCTFCMVETKGSILPGQEAKFSGHRKTEGKLFFFIICTMTALAKPRVS